LKEEVAMRPSNIVALARRRRATVFLAAAAALVAAATAFGATAALPPYKLVLDYQAYVGGKGKANPNLAPVKIGFINGQGGPVQFNFPQATSVIRAGVKMVNAELGGINRHPLQLSECFWAQAEEEGIRCGQQMVNDKVKTIIFGFVTVPNQAIFATVRGTIPVTGVITSSPADTTAKNAYFLNGSQTTGIGAFGTYTKRHFPKVKTTTVVYPDSPGAITAAAAVRTGLRQVGVKVTMIAVPALATDLIGPATQAARSDMIVAALGFTTCVPFARALDQLRYSKPVMSTPICTFIPKGAYAGGDLPKWVYGIVQTLVNKPGPQSNLYLKKGLQYGTNVPDMLWVFSEGAWETLLATVKIMNAIPYSKLSNARIAAGFKAFRGPTILGPPNVACGKVSKSEPTACGNQTNFYEYLGKGKWKLVSSWLKPPGVK
jgi:branched-chain amino acid transport system substrate-binding protein